MIIVIILYRDVEHIVYKQWFYIQQKPISLFTNNDFAP